MDFIKEWTYSVCITLVISVVFSLLLPTGNFSKFSKMLLSVFVFLSFILPIKNIDLANAFPEFEIDEIEISQQETYENIIETNIKNALIDGGYDGCITEADISVNDEEIEMNNIIVYVSDEYNKEEVKNYLFDKLGIVSQVNYIGE